MQVDTLTAAIVGGVSLAFVLVGLSRRGRETAARFAPSSLLGIALQASAFLLVFAVHPSAPNAARVAGAVVLILAGLWIMVWAQRSLGRQWSVSARLVRHHRLITNGPYARVRHPIYFGALLLLLAAGLARATPLGFPTTRRLREHDERHILADDTRSIAPRR